MEEHLSPSITIVDQIPDKVGIFRLRIPESTFTQNVQSLIVEGSTMPAGSEPSVCRVRMAAETLKANVK